MSNSYNEAEVLRKAGVENFSKFLEAQGQLAKRTHLEAAIKCFENAFKASNLERVKKFFENNLFLKAKNQILERPRHCQ